MPTTQITIQRASGLDATYTLVPTPSSPGPRSITYLADDTVATVKSAFSNVMQTQTWPGADWRSWQINLPPMCRADAAQWFAFLMSLRGQGNVFQIGDPDGATPLGNPLGVPLVDGTVTTNNTPGQTTLYTRGWQANSFRLLLPGSYLQIGYRLYTCLDVVNSDANGDASFSIWPSIREQPADGTAITLANTVGLFRLASNTRQWSYDVAQLYGLSFKCMEAV